MKPNRILIGSASCARAEFECRRICASQSPLSQRHDLEHRIHPHEAGNGDGLSELRRR